MGADLGYFAVYEVVDDPGVGQHREQELEQAGLVQPAIRAGKQVGDQIETIAREGQSPERR